jgi:hypothetical protein
MESHKRPLIQLIDSIIVQCTGTVHSVLVLGALNAGWKAKSFARGRVLLCSELEHLHFRHRLQSLMVT